MPKLPLIEQNQNVGSAVGQQRADLEDFVPGWRQVDSAIRQSGEAEGEIFQGGEAKALAQQREALSSGAIGEAIQNTTDPIEKRWKQSDLSTQQVVASRLHMQWAKHALDRIKAGDVHDPQLTDKFLDDFDQNTGDVASQAATPEGQFYLTHALAEMRAQFGTQVMIGQSERAGQQIKKDSLELVNNRSETARVNPAMLPQLLQDHVRDTKLTASMLGGSQEQAEALRIEGGKVMAVSALEGLVLTNPQVVKQQAALPLEKRDPIFAAASKYVDGETMNSIALHADSRIKNNESEERQKLALARQEEQRNRQMQAGDIFNAMNAKQSTLSDGTPIKDAIAKLAASGAGFYLGVQLENEFKANGLDGTVLAGDSRTEKRISDQIALGVPWTVDNLMLLRGHVNPRTGVPDGIGPEAFNYLKSQVDRKAKPENQMNEQIKKAAITAANTKFKEAETLFGSTDTAGHIQSQHLRFLVDLDRETQKRLENGERAMDIFDKEKPGNLSSFYRSYIPTLPDIQAAKAYAKAHPAMKASDAAREQGKDDPDSYGDKAVKPDPTSPVPWTTRLMDAVKRKEVSVETVGEDPKTPLKNALLGLGRKVRRGFNRMDEMAIENEKEELKHLHDNE